MRQGTTPTHTFTLPISVEMIKTVEITYAQGGKMVLQKGNADVEMTGNKVILRLTQEDTFRLDATKPVQIQLRPLLVNGVVPDTKIMLKNLYESLSREVLT